MGVRERHFRHQLHSLRPKRRLRSRRRKGYERRFWKHWFGRRPRLHGQSDHSAGEDRERVGRGAAQSPLDQCEGAARVPESSPFGEVAVKALVKARPEEGLWLQDVPEPSIGINDVLIRVLRTGICGTDVHIYDWNDWALRTIPVPMVIGHEFVGEIVAVGSNVNDFRPGELVSGEGHVVCGLCRNCMAGRRHLCAHTSGVGVNRAGCFAELIALPMANIWRHDQSVDRDAAAIFDPFGNAVHTALTFDVVGEDVLITGAGPIGLMAAAVVRHAGARFVVITDVNEYRLDLARKMKVDLALNVTKTSIAEA